MATLKLKRTDEITNSKAKMVVLLNGAELAVLANGENKEIPIPAGLHTLKIKIDTQGSRRMRFRIAADETKTFVLSSNKEANVLGAFGTGTILLDLVVNGLLLLYYFTTGHNRYLKIQELDQSWN